MHVSFGLRSFSPGQLDLLNHLDQLSEGSRLHLLRRPGALNLYRAFGGSEVRSYLFVEHSRNDHQNHFLLPRSKRIEPRSNIRYFLFLFAPRAISVKCDANSIEKVLVAKRFRKEFDRSRLHSTDAHGNVAVAGEKNYGDTNISCRKLTLKIEAAQSRQPYVQHKTTGNIHTSYMEKAVGGVEGFSLQTYRT